MKQQFSLVVLLFLLLSVGGAQAGERDLISRFAGVNVHINDAHKYWPNIESGIEFKYVSARIGFPLVLIGGQYYGQVMLNHKYKFRAYPYLEFGYDYNIWGTVIDGDGSQQYGGAGLELVSRGKSWFVAVEANMHESLGPSTSILSAEEVLYVVSVGWRFRND